LASYFLDGERVICQASGNFGLGNNGETIVKLAIAKYDNAPDDAIYLFACSALDVIIGDLLYASVNDAKQDALRFYEVDEITWFDI